MQALIVLAICLSCASASPNLVVIIADDLGRNDIGAFGTNQIRTRNIDALGFNGVLFDRHYTQQACTPSRSAFLTGRYPFRMGMQGIPADAGENREIPHKFKTLPRELKKLGYATHLVGKWHLGAGHRRALPQSYGYDEHYGYWNGYVTLFGQRRQSVNLGFSGVDFHNGSEPVFADKDKTTTQLLSQRSLEIIRDHPPSKPLFLVVSHLVGHTSRANGSDTAMEVSNLTRADQNYPEIEDEARRMLAENIQEMDDTVGSLVKALEEKGMLENTILLFFSDNGAPTVGLHANHGSNFPLRGIKMQPFEGGVRVPAMLYSPLLRNKGRVFRKLVHITDWVPTLYRAAGGDPSVFGKIDGIDQWDNIAGDLNQDRRKELLVDIDERRPHAAVIGEYGRYKFVIGAPFKNDGYLGASERDGEYNVDSIMNSTVNQVIRNHGPALSAEQFLQLRDAVTIEDCRDVEKPPNCIHGCLFDLKRDPCEGHNVMGKHPGIAFKLNFNWMIHALHLRMQQKQSTDPDSNPKYCCGTWFNWLDKDGCFCKQYEN